MTKRGVASLYVVLFATLLFGVVTLSFMRIILSEAGKSSDDDLSQSAYDSAMAGVEDAKRAVNRYYACLGGSGNPSDCDGAARDKLFDQDCTTDGIGLARYLYNYSSGEVLLSSQNSDTGGIGDVDNNSDQAYTCVIVSDVVPDYRGTLSSDTSTRVIPLAVYDGQNSTNAAQAQKIVFQWYSLLNEGNISFHNGDGKFHENGSDNTIPPTIQLTLIHYRNGMDFKVANDGANYATVLLQPGSGGKGNGNAISYSQLEQAGNVNKQDPNNVWDRNQIFSVNCVKTDPFACKTELDISGLPNKTGQSSLFLVVSLPYHDKVTDFAASMKNSSGENIDLVGSQISVDSTGRTNQLVRRVESRLDPADLYFPYPQYELELTGDGDNTFNKYYRVTTNCWYSGTGQTKAELRGARASVDAAICEAENFGPLK